MEIIKHESIIKKDIKNEFNLKKDRYDFLYKSEVIKVSFWRKLLFGGDIIRVLQIYIGCPTTSEIKCLKRTLPEAEKIAQYLEENYIQDVTIIITEHIRH